EVLYDIISRRTIPPEEHLVAMSDIAGQQWLDGAQSIIDPRRKGRQPLPLCVLILSPSRFRSLTCVGPIPVSKASFEAFPG
ncbi:hypothetical protein BDZ89DRAFT_1064979, partial [Hymenopellis radicata]